jgi:hypothetical protein
MAWLARTHQPDTGTTRFQWAEKPQAPLTRPTQLLFVFGYIRETIARASAGNKRIQGE